MLDLRMRRVLVATVAVALVVGCATINEAVSPRTIAQIAPEPVTPLPTPTQTMTGGKGDADAPYPQDFAVTVKSDGSIVFPEHTLARIKGSAIYVSGQQVITVGDDGHVAGSGLKHRYKFDADGQLLDDTGHGVGIAPDGGVRGIGGDWQWRTVFAWTPDGGGGWNKSAWHTLEIVALVMLENMVPRALRSDAGDAGTHGQAASSKDGGDDKGLSIHIPPPSEWFK
jgi:hypothetical protein